MTRTATTRRSGQGQAIYLGGRACEEVFEGDAVVADQESAVRAHLGEIPLGQYGLADRPGGYRLERAGAAGCARPALAAARLSDYLVTARVPFIPAFSCPGTVQ